MSSHKAWFVLPAESFSKSLLAQRCTITLLAMGLAICSALGCSQSPTTAQAKNSEPTYEATTASDTPEQPAVAHTNQVVDTNNAKPNARPDLPIVSAPIATTPSPTARIAAAPLARNSNAITEPATNVPPATADTADGSPQSSAVQSSSGAKPTQKNASAKAAKEDNKTFDLTFDDLAFDMEKGSTFKRTMLTPDIKGYDGGVVRLRGYIRPSTKQKGLTKFVFVRDNKECCFGPGAALYDCVLVSMAKGSGAEFTVRPVTIEGKFYIKEYLGPDDKIWAVFRMKDGKVK